MWKKLFDFFLGPSDDDYYDGEEFIASSKYQPPDICIVAPWELQVAAIIAAGELASINHSDPKQTRPSPKDLAMFAFNRFDALLGEYQARYTNKALPHDQGDRVGGL